MTEDAMVEVTQADIDAAAEYNRLFPELRLTEAFARHRIAAEARQHGDVEALEMACSLIQEAKGFEGERGGPITDHLDSAERWIEQVMNGASPALPDTTGRELVEKARADAPCPADCNWPAGERFSFRDDPGEHDPCYIVMPGGSMLPLNHDAAPGVDIARAHFIINACNAALADPSVLVKQPFQIDTGDDGLVRHLEAIEQAWEAHALANARMNEAVPDVVNGTPAERALYGERYKAAEEAKRKVYRVNEDFAIWAAENQASTRVHSLRRVVVEQQAALSRQRVDDRMREALAVIEPFARAYPTFGSMGPDGIDDGLNVVATLAADESRAVNLDTADFAAAAAFIARAALEGADHG